MCFSGETRILITCAHRIIQVKRMKIVVKYTSLVNRWSENENTEIMSTALTSFLDEH